MGQEPNYITARKKQNFLNTVSKGRICLALWRFGLLIRPLTLYKLPRLVTRGTPLFLHPFSAILGRDSYLYSLPYRLFLFSQCIVVDLRHPKRIRKEDSLRLLAVTRTPLAASNSLSLSLTISSLFVAGRGSAYISKQGGKAAVEPILTTAKKVIFFTYGCPLALRSLLPECGE